MTDELNFKKQLEEAGLLDLTIDREDDPQAEEKALAGRTEIARRLARADLTKMKGLLCGWINEDGGIALGFAGDPESVTTVLEAAAMRLLEATAPERLGELDKGGDPRDLPN